MRSTAPVARPPRPRPHNSKATPYRTTMQHTMCRHLATGVGTLCCGRRAFVKSPNFRFSGPTVWDASRRRYGRCRRASATRGADAVRRCSHPSRSARMSAYTPPLVVVEQRPMQVAIHVDAILHGVVQPGQRVVGVVDAPVVVVSFLRWGFTAAVMHRSGRHIIIVPGAMPVQPCADAYGRSGRPPAAGRICCGAGVVGSSVSGSRRRRRGRPPGCSRHRRRRRRRHQRCRRSIRRR